MAPLEREIAALRAKASLADSERRRCREERKWAVSQGNDELAGELKANYKRFKALMEECHKEADALLLESEPTLLCLPSHLAQAQAQVPKPEAAPSLLSRQARGRDRFLLEFSQYLHTFETSWHVPFETLAYRLSSIV